MGLAAGQFKAGAPCQSEGLAKFNQVIVRFSAPLVLSFSTDLAAGLAAGQFKAGAPCQSERLAKYNQVNLPFLALLVLFASDDLAVGLAWNECRGALPERTACKVQSGISAFPRSPKSHPYC